MRVESLHSWDVSPTEAIRIQQQLRQNIRLETLTSPIRRVAGADVSYALGSDEFYAGVVVLSFPDLQPLEERWAVGKAPFPYVPGLLSFREAPVLLEAFQQVTSSPDVVVFDGQGIAHPRRMGLASHLGLWLQCPSVGCAKHKLTGEYDEQDLDVKAGSSIPLYTKPHERIGSVVRTKDHVKPVFVSPGHLMDVESSVEVVLRCCKGYKLPEPTRLAHLFVNRIRRQGNNQFFFS